MSEDDLDLIDDPYRTCEVCDLKYHMEFGGTCEECDIWVCENCKDEHFGDPRHP